MRSTAGFVKPDPEPVDLIRAPMNPILGTLRARHPMAEKKVSVRLSAEGGRQVRAELEGIGTAGRQAFGQVTLAQKSAAESAAVFVAALDREDQAFRDLRASLDPAFAATERYETAVEQATRAVRAGVATQEEANRVIALARGRLDMFGSAVATGGRGLNAWRARSRTPPSSCRTSRYRSKEGPRPRPRWRCSSRSFSAASVRSVR